MSINHSYGTFSCLAFVRRGDLLTLKRSGRVNASNVNFVHILPFYKCGFK